jgi:hypothetical protein
MLRVENLKQVARKLRNPEHRWQVRHRPFQITPCLIAPVLPGETLKNAVMQSRVVTDPIRNPLVGWWIEYYFFYVKHRDLGQQVFLDMMLDPNQSLASVADNVDSVDFYHEGALGSPNWVRRCYEKCVEHYFRDQDELWNQAMIGNYAAAQVNHNSWMDSLTLSADYLAGDFEVDGPDANTTVQASELSRALMLWEHLRANNMTEMTYEDYLRSYGVKVRPEQEMGVPELIRYVREWSYPTNTVEATTGVPSSAVSWGISERIDKDRYFKEPGFIIGLTVARPKVYFSNQTGNASQLLNDAFAWLPAIMRDDPMTSMKQVATGANGLLTGAPNGYWVDVRDLYLYGDQFVNFALTETNAGLVALPPATLTNIRYPTQAMVDALFVGVNNLVRQDGVVRLSILGTQVDQTPRGNTMGVRM